MTNTIAHTLGEVVYYESIKRGSKIKPIPECRCDEKLKTKAEGSTRLAYTGLLGIGCAGKKKEKKNWLAKQQACEEQEKELDEYENCDVKHCDLLDHIVYVRSFFQCCGYASTMVRSH